MTLSNTLAGFIGARLERRDSEYGDSAGVSKDFDHTYWTGRLGLIWRYEADSQFYVTMSRGARAGGANAGLLASVAALPPQNQDAVSALGVFQEETLLECRTRLAGSLAHARVALSIGCLCHGPR